MKGGGDNNKGSTLKPQYEWLKTADFESAFQSVPCAHYFDVRLSDNQEIILTRNKLETLLRDRRIFVESVEMGIGLDVAIDGPDFDKILYRPRPEQAG
jgi:hypothetical protein